MFDSLAINNKKKIFNIHIIGICGIGMSALAFFLCDRNYKITGSDRSNKAKILKNLQEKNIIIYPGHDSNNIKDIDLIICSAAIKKNNPEYQYAIKNNIPILSRAEALAYLFKNTYNICITGTHGKSTTTAMVHKIINNDISHTLILGAIDKELQSNYSYSSAENLLLELDESDNSLNYINSSILLINNIDTDHLSSTRTLDDLFFLFYAAIMKIKDNGYLIICDDDPMIKLLFDKYPDIYKLNIIKYSINKNSDAVVKLISYVYIANIFSVKITISYNNNIYSDIILPFIGKFNITNAIAAISVGIALNIDISDIIARIKNFKGIERRLDFQGLYNGCMVIDDYAHHPTEIKNIIDTIKEYISFNKNYSKLLIIIKPMRLSRLNYLFQEHIDVVKQCNNVIILPTDQYDENSDEFPLDSYKLYEKLKELNNNNVIYYTDTKENLKEIIDKNTTNGDILLFLGAGTICEYSKFLISTDKKEK
ncbi:MAG: UDP-N-acetylmuramate--L-alanine ligase [Anaplasmataceae bacterium]|nr:UDP-N-acetylmuramate--L-alanine ligase [Anaplasmataceae bacterium]